MKPALIFQQYIWLVNVLRQNGRMSLDELSNKWKSDKVADGKPLSRTTFNRHRDAVLDMFGIIIDCDTSDGYKYYISNPEVLNDNSVERWMLSTLTVGDVLHDSLSVKDRIFLENVPAGDEFLNIIIKAIKTGRKLDMSYQKFGASAHSVVVAPYALKLFHRRWYLLADNGCNVATYSLDRMVSLSLTGTAFSMPADFSPEVYFAEYFGVLTLDLPLAHVVVRAYNRIPDYLRTLPLHQSQTELYSTDSYTDFAFNIRPTNDFLNSLLAFGDGVEVLEPVDFRTQIAGTIASMHGRYQ